MSKIKTVLVVANSGRMIAQLANDMVLPVIVIDCFADIDTQELTLKCVKVKSLLLDHLKAAFFSLRDKYSFSHVIYGSGIERYPDSLAFLHQHSIVLGNSLKAFKAVQNKVYFFSTLKQLGIPYPKVLFQVTPSTQKGLIKPMQGEGGLGIKTYEKGLTLPETYYWQRYVDGAAMSVVFATDGGQFIVYGYHKQTIKTVADNEFFFSGIISQPEMNEQIIRTVTTWIEKAISAFSLKGINSLDFIVNNDGCYLLEINPRLSASIQLYKANLLAEHIKCFSGGVLDNAVKSSYYQGYKIIFAEFDCVINEQMQWPEWVIDIPRSALLIHTGLPICSIIACGKNEQYIEDSLLEKQQIIYRLLREKVT